jgi:hypothetical protein
MSPLPDSIPVRVPPLPGEAIDSWLEAYARSLRCTVSDLLKHGGIAVPRRHILGTHPWTPAGHAADFAALSALTGVPVQTLNTMTFAHYDGSLLTLAPLNRSPGPVRWWNHTIGSRYCPTCLAEDHGRWRLEWRLPWTFACRRHARLLADICPACGRFPRDLRWTFQERDLAPLQACRSTPRGQSTATHASAETQCRQMLDQTDTRQLPAALVQHAQARITGLIEQAVATRADVPDRLGEKLAVFDDLYTVARSTLSAYQRSAPGQTPELVTAVADELNLAGVDLRDETPHHGARRFDAQATAFAVTVAVHTLSSGANQSATAVMEWLARHEMRDTTAGYAEHVLRRWNTATPGLRQAILTAIGPRLRPTEQLRYRTATPTPRPPESEVISRRESQVPALFWRGWALRLNPGRYTVGPFRTTLSSMLLLVGSDEKARQTQSVLGRSLQGGQGLPSWLINSLRRDSALAPILEALCLLADRLDAHGSPIDYTRRRERFTSVDLDWDLLRKHFDQHGLAYPSEARRRYHRLRVLELLTGDHPQSSPVTGRRSLHEHEVTRYERATTRHTTVVSAHLYEQAHRLLLEADIDEPVDWEPPFDWVPDIAWPGPYPDDVDINALHRLLRPEDGMRQAAKGLGISLEHVRVAALRHPRPAEPQPKIPSSKLPSSDDLRQAVEAGSTLVELAEQFNCGATTLKRLSAHHGIQFPHAGGPAYHVDPQWLRDQITVRHRTIQELADELGVNPITLGVRVRAMGLKGTFGTVRHPLTPFGVPDDFTPGLWEAFKGRFGTLRVRRLLDVTQHATISAAAAHSGTTERCLRGQFKTIEEQTGHHLLERKASQWTTTLTPAGQQFADEARVLLEMLDNTPANDDTSAKTHPALVRRRDSSNA